MRPPRAAALLVLALGTVSGCGARLFIADVQPAPRHVGPLEVAVSAAGATEELVRAQSDGVGSASVVALELEVRNRTNGSLSLDLSAMRLRLGSVGGPGSTVAPLLAGEGPLPTSVGRRGGAGAVRLAPAQSLRVWVAFGGFAPQRLPWTGETVLVLPGTPEATIKVASPVEPTSRLTLKNGPFVFNMRLGLVGARESFSFLQFESLAVWGPLVVGMSTSSGSIEAPRDASVSERDAFAFALGPRLGWLPSRFPVGVLAGLDGIHAMGTDENVSPPGRDDGWGLRFLGVLRFSAGPRVGLGGGMIPAEHRAPTPFRAYTFDVGYGYLITSGALQRGHGVIFTLGAPLLFF